MTVFRSILWLFTPLYRLGLLIDQWRQRALSRQLDLPVISVGNLTIGGTGKTAFIKYLLEGLTASGYRPAVLKRGEATRSGIILPGCDITEGLSEYGDEVALLKRNFPEVGFGVGKKREQVARELLQKGEFDLLLMDDGFQYRQLKRDLDIVLLESDSPDRMFILPAGPLREPSSSLKRADLISIRDYPGEIPDKQKKFTIPVISHQYKLQAIRQGDCDVTDRLKTVKLRLVTTLARPEKFEQFLTAEGYQIAERIFLPDHGEIPEEVLQPAGGPETVVMTEKELVKLPVELQGRVNCVYSKLQIKSAKVLWKMIASLVGEINYADL